jgi:hypothetical protein
VCIPFGTKLNQKLKTASKKKRIPRTAACGRLIIGVPYNEPNTPPLELVVGKVLSEEKIEI